MVVWLFHFDETQGQTINKQGYIRTEFVLSILASKLRRKMEIVILNLLKNASNALRERHRDLLYRGVFCADCCHTLDNPDVQSNAFRLGDRLAVLLTQSDRDVRKPASRFRAMSAWSWIRFPAMSPWKAIPSFFRAMPLRW